MDSMWNSLFGFETSGKWSDNQPSDLDQKEIANGVITKYPDLLQVSELAPISHLGTSNIVNAVDHKQATDDIQTVFFLNFHPAITGDDEAVADLEKIKGLLQSWQAWISARCEVTVQNQINLNRLPGDESVVAMSERSSYRAKVFEYAFKNATWSVVSL